MPSVPPSHPPSSGMPGGGERRAAPRHALGKGSCYALVVDSGGKTYPAQVRDVSVRGIGLLVGRSYLPGTLLTVDVTCPSGSRLPTLLVRVAHSTPQPDGRWLVGGAFLRPPRAEDLQELLRA